MKLFPRARRRRPGLYAYRTRKHLRRGVEWGYAGMSTSLPDRFRCHAGTCGKHTACAGGKPWYDLKAGYFELRLPWWLGWKWFLLSIETIMIVILRPRYNVQKNPRRNKVRKVQQGLQRAQRDRARLVQQRAQSGAYGGNAADLVVRSVAVALILAAPLGYYLTH